jgi:hypothetical protein
MGRKCQNSRPSRVNRVSGSARIFPGEAVENLGLAGGWRREGDLSHSIAKLGSNSRLEGMRRVCRLKIQSCPAAYGLVGVGCDDGGSYVDFLPVSSWWLLCSALLCSSLRVFVLVLLCYEKGVCSLGLCV